MLNQNLEDKILSTNEKENYATINAFAALEYKNAKLILNEWRWGNVHDIAFDISHIEQDENPNPYEQLLENPFKIIFHIRHNIISDNTVVSLQYFKDDESVRNFTLNAMNGLDDFLQILREEMMNKYREHLPYHIEKIKMLKAKADLYLTLPGKVTYPEQERIDDFYRQGYVTFEQH